MIMEERGCWWRKKRVAKVDGEERTMLRKEEKVDECVGQLVEEGDGEFID